MAIKHRLLKVSFCLFLAAGSLMGLPITHEQIEELLALTNQARVEMTITEKEDNTDDDAK